MRISDWSSDVCSSDLRYMPLPNYYNNWVRLGFSESELANGGNERFLDAMVAWGTEAQIRERIDAHFAAGATHVCIQPLRPDESWAPCSRALEAFAPARYHTEDRTSVVSGKRVSERVDIGVRRISTKIKKIMVQI